MAVDGRVALELADPLMGVGATKGRGGVVVSDSDGDGAAIEVQ